MSQLRTRIVIIGGGPGGYEAALVAAQLGASVTVIEDNGLGGACVLTDCVPSKTLIATSSMMAALEGTQDLGIRFGTLGPGETAGLGQSLGPDQASDLGHAQAAGPGQAASSAQAAGPAQLGGLGQPISRHQPASQAFPDRATQDQPPHARPPLDQADTGPQRAHAWADARKVNTRIRRLAQAQSADVAARLAAEGVDVISGTGRLVGPGLVAVGDRTIEADTILISTGARPRELEEAIPDGERLLTSRQIYDLGELPEELIVVGSGVTGAEFASAFCALGSKVTLVSSREHVLPNEDTDAAMVIEDVFRRSGMRVLGRSRAQSARRTANGVEVTLADGRVIEGSHCLLTVGMVPLTEGLGLDQAKVETDRRGFVTVDKVSRTSTPGVYAAGDCTGVLMLASVAAMQGRIAMWHALGEAVHPLRLSNVAATIFTAPEIATVGVSQEQVDSGKVSARTVKMPLATNARAKMDGFSDGFVKLFARPGSGSVLGGVIVAPRASELILSVSLAVERQLTVDEVAQTFAVYPSLTGSITEAARRLMEPME